jgi:putative membrane protein
VPDSDKSVRNPTNPRNPPTDPRVLLAADRTLLAWIRTGIAMMGFGFVVARFGLFLRELAAANGSGPARPATVSPVVGTGLILLGSLAVALATIKHIRFLARYKAGEELEPAAVSLETVLAGLLVIAGIGLALYLFLV